MRHPVRLAIGAFVAGIAAIVLAFVLSQNTHRGTGTAGVEKVAGLQAVSLGQDAVHDFDPFGTPDQHEHANQTGFADDRNPATYWSTESYSGGTLGSKPGVGIYIDAAPEVAARTLEVQTPDPGWTAQVYAAAKGPPSDIGGWTLVGSAHTVVESKQRFDLNTGGRAYRYYLLWITKLKQGATQAKVSEIGLLR
jgi:serine/threonine-protein kinase